MGQQVMGSCSGFSRKSSQVKDLATVAYERCGGNPRVLVDLIKTLSPEIDTASSSETSLLKLQTLLPEAGEENLVGRRWGDLSETSRQVVSVASVIGRKFALDLLEEVSRASRPDVLRAVAEGLKQQVLASWTILGEEWHCFANEQIHEEVYSAISARERLRLHREIAEALERKAEDDDSAVYEIALHYLRGENPGRAFRAVVRAADAAKKAYANREAIYFFSEALEILPDPEGAMKLEFLEDLGDVCALDGQYERAKSSYQRVLEVLDDPVHKARLEGKIGDMYFRRGMNESAIDHLTRALAWIGLRSPRSRLGLGWSILRNTVVQAIHTLAPKPLLTLNNRKVRDIGREAVKIFHALAYANYFLDLPRTLEVHLRQLNLAERLGDSPELAHTYSAHGIVCSLIPLHGRANRYQLAGLEIREQFGDRWGVGQSYAFLGVCSYYRSNLPLAIEYLRKSVNILESTGDQWEIEAAYSHLAFCFVLQGNVDAAEDMSRMLLKLSQEIHDLKFVAIAQTTLAECELIRGNLDQALSLTGKALETAGDNFTEAMAMRVRGQALLRLDRRQEALEVLEGSLALIRKHRLMNEYLVANHIAYAHALLSDVDTILAMDIRSRRKYLARSNQHIRKGVRLARRFRNHLGYALRVRALYHCFRGSAARAESSFAQSERVLMEHGRVYELALTQLARVRWKLRAGKLKDAEELTKVVEVFRKVGARLDVEESRALSKLPGTAGATQQRNLRSQRQQLSSLFKVSRAISSILELDLLSVQITDLAVEITGGEKAYLFLRGAKRTPEVRCVRGLDKKEMSIQLTGDDLALVSRAWNSGVTQVVATTELTEKNPSREGSVICVPLRIKERTFGLIYVENSLSTDLYTEDDLEFIGIFASQAAISLQNAFSYRKVEELYLSLERKVRERTRELLENKRKLEDANRLKSEFLANMSHELRTPLNAVIAMSEILLERTFGELNEKQEVYLQHILESGVHLLSLINDVLNLSKVEAGQLHLELDLVDLHEWIQASLVVVRERATKHDISLRFEPGTEDALVQGDARRLKQVLINLLSNAVKFTPDGGQVTVRTSKDAAGVIVCVEDTGIGIAPEDQLIVFEEFRQVDSSYSRRYEGSGLGLALCKKFIELHGGKIWLESEEGKGSKFYFCLPPHENPAISRTPVASGADQQMEATE